MAAVEVAHADEGYTTNAGAPKDGPVLTMMSKRLRALRKKYNKILQIEENKAQGKVINREQEEVVRTKIAVAVLIDEYEKLRQPLLAAVKEELAERERELLTTNTGRRGSEEDSVEDDKETENKEEVRKEVVNGNANHVQDSQDNPEQIANGFLNGVPEHSETQVLDADSQYQTDEFRQDADEASLRNDTEKGSIARVHGEETSANGGLSETQVADLLSLMYFARLFDVKPEGELPSFVWTKVHERSSCLSYDFVFDDATTPLTEGDLDALSLLGSLLTSRPPNVTVSHKDALEQCIHHARFWLLNSDNRICPELNASCIPKTSLKKICFWKILKSFTLVAFLKVVLCIISTLTIWALDTGLRERLNRILLSEYFSMTPELQTVTQQTAAAAASAATHYVSKILIPEAMSGSQISEVEESLVHETSETSSQQQYFEGKYVSPIPLSTGDELPVADPSVNISYASEDSSVAAEDPQADEDQTALSLPHSTPDQETEVQQKAPQPLPPTRQRQQHNPSYNGGDARGGGYQGTRGNGRGYGYAMGGRGRGYANARGNRGSRGYYGRGGQFYDQGGYYPRNQFGGRSGRGGRGGFVNGHVNGTPTAAVTGQA